MRLACCALILTHILASFALADDPLGGDVRKTEPNTPDAQQKMFHVPDGFRVQLIAADPEIDKPMNLAFDARGRLWVTETHLYPMPASRSRTSTT